MRGLHERLRRARAARQSTDSEEAGFTLIELMVVLLIIAILLAVAVPTFLGVTSSANDRAAQATATNALKEAVAAYDNNAQTFTNAPFATSAPEFTWSDDSAHAGTNLATASANTVSYWVGDAATAGDGQALIVATYAKGTGTCWYAVNLEAPPAGGGSGITGDSQSFVEASGAGVAGTFYASSRGSDCQAGLADPPFTWGPAWATAGSNTVTTSTSTTTVSSTTTTTAQTPTCVDGHPCIESVTPSSAPAAGGATITISGSNFSSQGGCPPACSSWVSVNGQFANVVSWTDSTVVITVPSGSAGAATIVVATHLGASTSNSTLFSYS